MRNPNLADFYGRVSRIEQAYARGNGFEARGTLGRSSYKQGKKKSPSRLARRALTVVGFCIIAKGVIHQHLGGGAYDQRVATLMDAGGFDRVGGYLMQADVLTLWVSNRLDILIRAGIIPGI